MFQKGLINNLISTQQDVLALLEKKQEVDMISLDLSKTYDVVNHRFLLAKT